MTLDRAMPWYRTGNGPWFLAVLIAAILAAAAYVNGLGGEFVLDDRAFLVDNPQLSQPHDFAYFFSENFYSYSNLPDAYSASYRPLSFAVLWLGNYLWPGSALALHLFSLSLHITATLLVLRVISRLIPSISAPAAGLGACIFAVHPVHVEAVSWILAFPHPMATVLILASYLFHDHHQRTKSIHTFILASFFFLIALLIAETAIGFPILILAFDWIRHARPRLLSAAPYFVLLAFYFVVRNAVLGEATPLVFFDPDAWLRFPIFLAEYLRHLILPYPQPLYLSMPSGWQSSLASGLAVGFLTILFVFLLVKRVRDRRELLFAAAWIFATLLPPLAASFHPTPLFALRSLYMPSVGIALLVACVATTFDVAGKRVVFAVVAAFLLLPLGITIDANRDWQDNGRVYRRIIASSPEHFAGYLGLGRYLARTGETQAAVRQYEKSITLAGPKDRAGPLEALGLLLGQSGDSIRSLEIYRQLTILEPNRSGAWVGVGNNLWYLGKLPEAAEAYRRAHAADVGNREACYNLVLVLEQLGRTEEAARYANCATRQP